MKGVPDGVEVPQIRMVNDRILLYLEPDPDGFSDAPSLVKPDTVKPDHVYRIGRVVRKGPGAWHEKKGERIPVEVEVGARVMFVKFLATHTETGKSLQGSLGKDFAIVQEKDLLLEVDEEFDIRNVSQ